MRTLAAQQTMQSRAPAVGPVKALFQQGQPQAQAPINRN